MWKLNNCISLQDQTLLIEIEFSILVDNIKCQDIRQFCYTMQYLQQKSQQPPQHIFMIGWGIFFSIQLIQIDLSQMKWNNLFSLFFFMKRQLKQPFGEMSTSIFNQFTFMTRRAKSRTNEQQVQVFMSLTSVSNISQLKIKEKFMLQLLPQRYNAYFFY